MLVKWNKYLKTQTLPECGGWEGVMLSVENVNMSSKDSPLLDDFKPI